MGNEDSLYTYVLLNNSAWYNSELSREQPYFYSVDPAKTNGNSAWNTVKDLAISGLYQPGQLPSAFLSRFGVHVPISAGVIVETHKASNGIVYVVSASAPAIAEKIPVVTVQGETPIDFSSTDAKYMAEIFYRQRNNPVTGLSFNDIYMNLGSSGALISLPNTSPMIYAVSNTKCTGWR